VKILIGIVAVAIGLVAFHIGSSIWRDGRVVGDDLNKELQRQGLTWWVIPSARFLAYPFLAFGAGFVACALLIPGMLLVGLAGALAYAGALCILGARRHERALRGVTGSIVPHQQLGLLRFLRVAGALLIFAGAGALAVSVTSQVH
jgi:hypothetical protein